MYLSNVLLHLQTFSHYAGWAYFSSKDSNNSTSQMQYEMAFLSGIFTVYMLLAVGCRKIILSVIQSQTQTLAGITSCAKNQGNIFRKWSKM